MYFRGPELSSQCLLDRDKDHANVSIPRALLFLEKIPIEWTKEKDNAFQSCLPHHLLLRGSSGMLKKKGRGLEAGMAPESETVPT